MHHKYKKANPTDLLSGHSENMKQKTPRKNKGYLQILRNFQTALLARETFIELLSKQ
jgi:hypothetical protein